MTHVIAVSRIADVKEGDRVLTHPSNLAYLFTVVKKEVDKLPGETDCDRKKGGLEMWKLRLKPTGMGGECIDYHGADNDFLYVPIPLTEFARAPVTTNEEQDEVK